MTAVSSRPPASRWLSLYLRDHYSASAGGLELFQRAARAHSDPQVRAQLVRLTTSIAEDRAALLGMLDALDVERSPTQERLVVLGERLGRLRTNGTLLRRSPLSDVLELDALCAVVYSKRLGWLSLRAVAEQEPRLNEHQLEQLIQRAEEQQGRLEQLRLATVRRVMPAGPSGDGPT
jgi:hypothetical protein